MARPIQRGGEGVDLLAERAEIGLGRAGVFKELFAAVLPLLDVGLGRPGSTSSR
ncbi:hypothetical protein ACR9VJ_34615 [Streptomyces sp. H49]|uniref:hypothetical protein n=1 Tax=Streptomyces sp. H49 TaxID=3444117 RepID=UPI003F4AC109